MDTKKQHAPVGRGAGDTAVCSDGRDHTTPAPEGVQECEASGLAARLAFGVPNELRELKGWLLWKRGQVKRGGKFDKVPYYALGGKRFGTQGGPEDRKRLVSFDEALPRLREGGYDGLGLAMLGQGVVSLDFDGCCDGAGIIAPWVLDLCCDTYAEISPSGTGIRAFYRGTFPDRKNHEAGIETFCRKGFVTVTGARLNGCDLAELPDAVASELARRLGPDKSRTDSAEVLSKACARDPTLARLNERGLVLRSMGGGKFDITCPWEADHSTPGGAGDTVYFAAHTGGYASGNFDCKHSHCAERTQAEFRQALGLGAHRAQAPTGDSPPIESEWLETGLDPDDPPIEGYAQCPEAQRGPPFDDPKSHANASDLIDAATLWAMNHGSVKWAVVQLLPEGVLLLAGKPKVKKSWLMLSVALAVASGGMALGKLPTVQGDVLYLALEVNKRRLTKRLRLLTKDPPPKRLEFATEWPRVADGGIERLESWLKAHPHARLIVVDTLARIRPQHAKRTDSAYTTDYEAVKGFIDLCKSYSISVVIVCHTRKMESDDPIDLISGTLGLTGGVDGYMLLTKLPMSVG